VQNQLEFFFFRAFSKIFCFLGLKRARRATTLLAFLFYYIIPLRKKVVIENLRKAFPELSEKEIKETAYKSYKSFAITLIEILLLPKLTKEELLNSVECPNVGLIKEEMDKGRGMILLTAHFGNWEYGAIAGGLLSGFVFNALVKQQRNELVDNWLNQKREKWGNRIIPLGISVRNVYQELKNKKLIAIVADQRGPADGVRVNMFGIPTAVYTGFASLHIKMNVPILVGIVVRQPDRTYRVELERLETDNITGSEEERVEIITQRYYDILERKIKKNPEQWLWMHKRWKY